MHSLQARAQRNEEDDEADGVADPESELRGGAPFEIFAARHLAHCFRDERPAPWHAERTNEEQQADQAIPASLRSNCLGD